MNRKEFGNLVIALRNEHTDNHNKTWTRSKLAIESEIDELVLGNIERGTKANLESVILQNLAKALQLTSSERKEFFAAATPVDNKDIPRELNDPEMILEKTLNLMSQIQQPSFLIDGFGEIIATNIPLMTVYDINPDVFLNMTVNPKIAFNLMRLFFGPEFEKQRKMMGDTWRNFAYESVAVFRTVTFRNRAHPEFREILGALNGYEEFKQSWYSVSMQRRDNCLDNASFILNHPQFGKLSCHTATIKAVTSEGDLELHPVLPLDSATAKVFASIIGESGVTPIRIAPWPK